MEEVRSLGQTLGCAAHLFRERADTRMASCGVTPLQAHVILLLNCCGGSLSQLELGQEIPPSLYQAIVDIYVYFLEFDPNDPDKQLRRRTPPAAEAEESEKEDA